MTMDLIGEQGQKCFNNSGWKMLIDLALRNGWKPAGAQEPDDEGEELLEEECPDHPGRLLGLRESDLDDPFVRAVKRGVRSVLLRSDDPLIDSYLHNDGLRVADEDARALADALERALPDVPDHDALARKAFEHLVPPASVACRWTPR
jgi:hypothetical protein